MKFFVGLLVVALCQAVRGGHVSIRMPFGSPAGVTYVDGSYHAGLAAGPVSYSSTAASASYTSSSAATSFGAPAPPATYSAPSAVASYAAPAAAATVSAAPAAVASYAAPAAAATIAAAPAAVASYAAPAAATVVSAPAAYAAIPTVHHVPGVADVPVTRIEAQPGVIQKVVDVAKPAVQTRTFEIRRPAIQKQFYDVEERVVVRPAGSAVVELDEPVSKTQKGPAVIQSAGPSIPVSVSPSPISPISVSPSQEGQILGTPSPIPSIEQPEESYDEDSVAIDNPEFAARSSLAGVSGPSTAAPFPQYERPQPLARSQIQFRSQVQSRAFSAQPIFRSSHSQAFGASQARSSAPAASYGAPQTFQAQTNSAAQSYSSPAVQAAPQVYSSPAVQAAPQVYSSPAVQAAPQVYSSPAVQAAPQVYSSPAVQSAPQVYSSPAVQAAPQAYSSPAVQAAPQAYSSPAVQAAPQVYSSPAAQAAPQVYSSAQSFAPAPVAVSHSSTQGFAAQARYADSTLSSESETNHANQQRFIELLTARGGVAEVGYQSGSALSAGGASQVRGRVVSATPAPAYSEPAGERVNTRRVVVSRPIETLQEVQVAEPVTKFERIQVSQPTLIKTARQDVLRVPTSVPVFGKTLAPIAPVALSAPHHPWQ